MAKLFLHRSAEKAANVSCYRRYESDLAVAQYCDAHYGPDKFGVGNFPQQLAKLCVSVMSEKPRNSALDLGCAVGRACFELAPYFTQVTGIDLSTRLIDVAQRLKEHGSSSYKMIDEGMVVTDRRVTLTELNLSQNTHNVRFFQGNAQRLDDKFNNYDLLLAANLIDRLPDPRLFLSRIHQRLVLGGVLVIASPNHWLEQFTPRKKWLGGYFRFGAPVSSLQGLSERLSRHFSMVREPVDVEFVIRQNARVFNHSISQVSFWQRER